MAIYPLSEIIFKTQELTGAETRLCPQCLVFNAIENTTCSNCSEAISNYTAETFIDQRIEQISEDSGTATIGIGSDNEKQRIQKEKFLAQYDLWDQVVLTAQFVNVFTMTRVDPRESARQFLRYFPMSSETIDQIKLHQINLQLNKWNSSEINKKLTEIERRGFPKFFTDFASWSVIFLDEINRPALQTNIRWMNVG